ncbi:hypothetical protein [Planobispora rosea]|uniref:hypothetical protein n=1 Tax=Planobispora rosea TaxID=35762 RepID=UPI00083B8ED3|nr:hypothetical protein [Planobispora rosea]
MEPNATAGEHGQPHASAPPHTPDLQPRAELSSRPEVPVNDSRESTGVSPAEPEFHRLALKLGFVVLFIATAVVLVALGQSALAVLELLAGAGWVAVQLLKSLG